MALRADDPGEGTYDNRMRLELPAQAENVALARVAVAAFAAQLPFSINELEDLKVAVSEAVTNAVVHAYAADGGAVTLDAMLQGDRLIVIIADEGCGIDDVAQAREASFSTRQDRMGLGFSFMESFTEGLEVSSSPGAGTRIRFEKRPREAVKDPADSPADPAADGDDDGSSPGESGGAEG